MTDSIPVSYENSPVFDAVLVQDPAVGSVSVRPYFAHDVAAEVATNIEAAEFPTLEFSYDEVFDYWMMTRIEDSRVTYVDFVDTDGGRVHGIGLDLVVWSVVEGEPGDPEPAP